MESVVVTFMIVPLFIPIIRHIYSDLLFYLDNEKLVEELLRKGTNANAEDSEKSTALHYTAQYGKLFKFSFSPYYGIMPRTFTNTIKLKKKSTKISYHQFCF